MTDTAYRNDPKLKARLVDLARQHREADRLVQGVYWRDGKGCAVGCTLESWRQIEGLTNINHRGHELYTDILGPGGEMLAWLEDCIFEGLPKSKAVSWPERFLAAIPPGADLSLVGWKFLHWLLIDEDINPGISHPDAHDAVKQCADVLAVMAEGLPVDDEVARSAASAARSAAESAAESAESAMGAARSAAWSAVSATVSATVSAAVRAVSAARSAARGVALSAAERAAERAESAAWSKMADKLIEFLEHAGEKTHDH